MTGIFPPIGIAWTVLASCIPLESWISYLIDFVKKRRSAQSDVGWDEG